MNKNNVFYLSLATFITIVSWIGFNIYHDFNTSTISETENIQIAPIKPTFDTQTISEVLQRKKVVPIFDAASAPSASVSGKPTIPPTQIPAVQVLPTTTPPAKTGT